MMTKNGIDVSLVLTCYNEGLLLSESFDQIEKVMRGSRYSWEIICIDDASTDGSQKILKDLVKERSDFRAYYHRRNIGRGGTVAEGIKKAKGRIVGYIDIDLEVSPVYIPEFVRTIDEGFDMVIARRIYREEFITIPRWISTKIYAWLVKRLLKLDFDDTEAGYKFFNKEKILPIIRTIKDRKWFFDTEIVARSCWKGLKITSIPTLFLRRIDKKSSVKLVSDGLEYLKRIWEFRKEVDFRKKNDEKDIFLPTTKQYRNHLEKYADDIKPAEITNWCAKVSPARALRVVRTLMKHKNDNKARVLDLGCGIGLNTPSIAKVFPKTVACDIDSKLEEATKDFLLRFGINIPVVTYDGKRLPFKDNSFEIVCCVEVFEHAKNPNLLLREINRVLKPGGIVHITSPNKFWILEGHYRLPFLSYLPKKWADRYVRITNKGPGYENIYLLPTYNKFYSMVNKYFDIDDITFDTVINYREFGVDKERGKVIIFLAWFLKLARNIKILNLVLLNLSIGWLFVGKSRKN